MLRGCVQVLGSRREGGQVFSMCAVVVWRSTVVYDSVRHTLCIVPYMDVYVMPYMDMYTVPIFG